MTGNGAARAAPLVAATGALVAIGILFVYSSGVDSAGESLSREWIKQIVWALTGFALLAVMAAAGLGWLQRGAPYLYAGGLLLLALTALFGREVNGARAWIGLGDFGVQPSEFTKLTTIVFLAAYFAGIGNGIKELPRFALGLAIVLLPVGLILLQPDMGTAIVYVPIFLVAALVAGAELRHLAFILGAVVVTLALAVLPALSGEGALRMAAAALVDSGTVRLYAGALLAIVGLAFAGYLLRRSRPLYWIGYVASIAFSGVVGSMLVRSVLQPYQIARLAVFLDPWSDPRGAGWNIIQSMTAVGSGGFGGKGFLQGTQSHYQYLPQQSTDFIFSILAEEWGFVGAVVVLALFAVILLRSIAICRRARDDFTTAVAAGIVGMFAVHVVVNIGMATGIMPITGIPLTFVSYGGSALWTGLLAVGMLLAVPRPVPVAGLRFSELFTASQWRSSSDNGSSPSVAPASRTRRSTAWKRRRNRSLAPFSASNGSTRRWRDRLTTANSRSPSSSSERSGPSGTA